jgi:tRNA pseudouridine38-40 synthase
MPTYRLTVEYDGTKLLGWQVQTKGRTVQGALREAIRRFTREPDLALHGAGRTDAGVHALGQVASFSCRRQLRRGELLAYLDDALPPDVAVRDFEQAPDGFHARHDAIARAYRYQLATRRSAFGKRFTWWVRSRLDVAAMAEGARHFEGRHDFAALTRKPEEHDSTVVVVEQCLVEPVGGLVLVRVVASHFLWGQVRRMVACLATVGTRAAAPADVPRWIRGELLPPAQAAPAAGLFLEAVRYPGEPWRLPQLLPLGVP